MILKLNLSQSNLFFDEIQQFLSHHTGFLLVKTEDVFEQAGDFFNIVKKEEREKKIHEVAQ